MKLTEKIKNYLSDSGLICYVLYHGNYKRTYKFLQSSEYWSGKKLETYQLTQLKKLMDHAYTNVPYYKTLFDKQGLKPSDINTLEDLRKIPFLTKNTIRNNLTDFKAKNYPESKFEYVTTGGSSGFPLGLYLEKFTRVTTGTAYLQMALNRIDCKATNKFVDIRAHVISSKNENKYWQYISLRRCLILSSFHINEENLPGYIDRIKKFKPRFIFAYPTTITLIAGYMKKNNIKPFSTARAIVCMGESLNDWQRDLLEDTLGIKILCIYGHAEQSAFAATCEKSNNYHFFPEFGIVELIDDNGKHVKKDGEIGEIVVTGLSNHICPFIRYRTGDLGVYTSEKCSCGRCHPMVKNIFGRVQEFIVTKDGKYIPMAAVNMHSDIFDNVAQCQFYQEKKGEVILYIVKSDRYTEKDTEKIRKEFLLKLGNDFFIDIKFVDEIKKTMRGKHSYLIQKIPFKLEDILKK